MKRKWTLFNGILLAALVASALSVGLPAVPVAAQEGHVGADAVVLVNPASAHYADFAHYVQPYLDNFGIPYTVLDISVQPVTAEIAHHALIIVGHDGLDETGAYLDSTEHTTISAAVAGGAGLVNLDSLLAGPGYVPRYPYVQDILDLAYGPAGSASSIEIGEGGGGVRLNCWEDDHQDPLLVTTTNAADLVPNDNRWTEFEWTQRGYPAVFGGYDEALPLMRFYAAVPDGTYTLVAHLYWSHNLRYYWGYSPGAPQAYSYDVTSGNAGDFADYTLGTVQVTGGLFELYVQNTDPLPGGNDYPFFGWAWIRLVPEGEPPSALHYITQRHTPDESIGLYSSMTVPGLLPPADAQVLATAGGQPFLVVRTYGQGRAVQWGSYAWMSHAVKGPLHGLDDLVWRSLAWAARKPFVMQGLPPFVTMRVDDESGPFWWIHVANEFDIKPWAGLFFHNVDDAEAADLSALVHAGQATTSIHAFNGGFFYFNHSGADWPDGVVAAHFAEGTQWHQDHDIPISRFALGHYYELGTNVFGGLRAWDVEFIGTQMDPGRGYGAPWIMNGPYRRYETGSSSSGRPMFYADFMTIPNHPEFDGQFFNCVTEIRDDAGYEWYPSNDVAGSIGRGTRQTRRALDSMALATLFTHGQHISGITPDNWRAILQGITTDVAPYDPIYVTMDYACQYVRATATSAIAQGEFDPSTGVLTTTLTGETDLPTQFYLFTGCGPEILEQRIDVPTFSGSTEVVTRLPGALQRIEISPPAVTLGFNDQQQFVAQGYDAGDAPVLCANYAWGVVNGGGTIDQHGLFTAGTTPGTFADTVTASDQGITGTATVVVAEFPVDHFAFDSIGDQVLGVPFTVTLTALDAEGLPVTSYDGTATLTDTTATIVPAVTGPFANGAWSGEVAIHQAATGVIIRAQDVATVGSSNPFTVTEPPPIPAYVVTSTSYVQTAGVPFTVTVSSVETTINLWEDEHQDPVLTTFTNPALLNDHDGQWDEFWYQSGRPYPTLLAGHNEWENNNLQPMHFFADGLPNGRYRVWANLYTSRYTRHYYGFTEAEARAGTRWVDNVAGAGGADQHDEYSLGIVEITGNRFDLWAGDGDLLGGSPYYYGWAWLRLEPALPETTINLWEDAHQDPVLTTFTNPALLNDHDGRWDEFLYTPSRPFPTLLAGHNEWENNGLQPMHFFATNVPDGIYEVWANLYTVRRTRYFYGFTEAEARAGARWVDVAANTAGTQHTEYNLGTVQVTGGRFDLWAGDGDLLSGTPYFYGWAWARLVASGMTMSSSSPGMLFDGDRDGTFGEPGDDVGLLVRGTFDIAARDTTAGSATVITATDSAGYWGRATYTILPGPLARVEIEPPAVSLPPYGQQQFTATGLDQWDNPIQGLAFHWDVVHGGGAIDQAGLFTAGFAPGLYAGTVVATAGGLSGTATVTVEVVPADHFEFEFIYEPQVAGVPIEIIVTAADYAGAPVTAYNGLPALSDTTGTLVPATIGPFTDGVWQGYVTIAGVANDVVIAAGDGTATGQSNPFDVLGWPAHIYSLTSTSYVQVVGHPFSVTVAPIGHTINLWEDAHQRPVLQTTTNAGDLNTTDGRWTEFHYVAGGRPFPSVMAGADEENYGLPTMHFNAVGIPNGTYQVIANLYTSSAGRNMRYYYGFTPGDPKALYVDTVGGAGGSDQHEEYNLGQVTIANGRFDLYVRDADILGGTYPIFGWAWVRLEPAFPQTHITMSSSSPTLHFDGDGDGTFGEAGDDVHLMTGAPFTTWAVDTMPGTNVLITATDDLAGTGVARYTILDLDTIAITPAEATLDPGGTQQFTAQAYDSLGHSIPGLAYAWSVANGGGTIDGNGLFTAGTIAGEYPATVVAGYAGVSGTASVTVRSGPPVALEWAPLYGPQYAAVPFLADLVARDAYGNVATGYNRVVNLSDTTATLTPPTVTLVDGRWTGELRVDAVAEDVVVSAQEGAFAAHTLPFDVLPAPEQSYLVTSGSYLQTAGVPFTVTVTAISGTVNLWEDNHQRPVLETFTDPALFNQTDGRWDEFLWAGHRDYPGVFGGITEAISETLEPLHFYAVVPNGTYRMIANLYRSNDYRYSYGFDPAHVRAHSVDVTSGPIGDFAEFDLGTVTVTGNRFNLYTDHAQVLVNRGAFPYFGWAWIRLLPVSPEQQINCWEDDHQEPVLATTTNPADLLPTDGRWTEFHYVAGGRPFPAVFAGAEEENYGLPVMHFSGDVPNGTYELIANLYTSGAGRNMRYYYGFTPDAPKALYVDTVGGSGGADEHTEYSLGLVTVAGGRFDLYVRDADLLPGAGTYPFFGWAWVRLVANRVTMSSSSPTMHFDADGDSTFGEPGDEVETLAGTTFDVSARDATAGTQVVIRATDDAGNWGAATYTVTHAAAVSMDVTPLEETVVAGQNVTYHATAQDTYSNTWDATAETHFSIGAGAGGTWADNVYTSQSAGDWTVTGAYAGLAGTATLHVRPAAALSVTKTSSADPARAGDPLTYTVTVLNTGPATALGVVVTDTLPVSVTLGSATPSQGTCSGAATLVCTLGDLPAGVTATVVIAVTPGAAGPLTNTAQASGTDPAGNPLTGTGTASLRVIGPAIRVRKEASTETASVGDTITYTYTVDNAGDATLTNVSASDDRLGLIPLGRTTLAPGETTTGAATYTVIESDLPGPLTNTVTVTGTPPAGDVVSNTATATVSLKPTGTIIYLPIVLHKSAPPAPDLVVERITVAGSRVQVVIRNQGDAPVLSDEEFWVDLYVDPHPVPTAVNQAWDALCSRGIVWGVTAPALPLEVGETIILTLGDDYYWADYSHFPTPLPAGLPIYVQVDSANLNSTYGGVLENHEQRGEPYNNISGPVFSALSTLSHAPAETGWPAQRDPRRTEGHRLPLRP